MKQFLSILGRIGRYLGIICLLLLLLISAFLWYITTDSFQQMVRGRLVGAIERATGGRAELGSFHVVPLRFQVEVRNLTIHGLESPREIPLAHVDSMSAIVNLSSVLGARIGFHSLTLQHPVVHVIFYPDGSTNVPTPKQHAVTDFDRLFAISIDRLEVRGGELLWQDQPIPLEFVSNDVSASLEHSFLRRRYSGTLSVGKAETQFDGYRPVAWAARAVFSVSRDEVEVQSLSVRAAGSHLQASGKVADLLHPVLKGDYDLLLNLEQAGSITRQPRLRAGSLHLQGNGAWSRQTFGANGKFDLNDAWWQGESVAAKNASAAGQFSADPQRVALSHVQGRIFHGSFASDAEVQDWRLAEGHGKSPNKDQMRGMVTAKFKDISLAEVLSGLGPQFRPANRLKLAGDVSGGAEMRWKNSLENIEIAASLAVQRPARTPAGQVPLTASTHLTYVNRPLSLQIAELTASTPATQMRASGSLSKTSSLNFSFASTDLREWQPITAELFPAGMPALIRGRAALNGLVTGPFPGVAFSGHAQLQDFDTYVRASAAKPFHWDSLNSDVQLSSRYLILRNATATSGNALLKLDGSAGLLAWRTTPQSALHFQVDAQNFDAGQLAAIAGYKQQISGAIAARGELAGTISKPEGQGTVAWANGAVQGYTFDSANAQVSLRGSQASLKDLHAARGPARVTGTGAYDMAARTFQFALSGTDFDLAEISHVERSRITIGGKLDFTAQASGSQAKPQVTAHLHLRNVTFDGETAGDYLIDAVTSGPDMRLTGHSDFKNAELSIDGNVRLRELWPGRIDFHFIRLDVDPFVESYLHGHITGHSAVAGDLVVQGPLRNPRQLTLLGSLTDLYADVEKVKIRNQGPIRFSVSNEVFKLDSFRLVGDSTDLSASGTMELSGEQRLDFNTQGKIGLQLLRSYDPDLSGSGELDGEARIRGTLSAPLVRGRVQVVNGGIYDVNLPSALSGLNGSFVFSQNQVTIENLTGHTGGGTVAFNGRAQIAGSQINFDVTADAEAVRLRYPPGVSSTANANLRWSGSSAGSLLSGDITVMKIGVTPGFDFGAYLERSIQSASLPQTDPVLNKIRLDLHVVTTPELQMQTSVLRLRGEADLRVRGSAAKPVLLGRADVFEGEAYFSGTKYRLERGGVTFTNPAVTTPFLDLEATTRVRDYDVTLSITGPADRPKLNYRSEPPLATNDIIALLAFGQTSEESAQLQQTSQSAFSQQASSAMLAAALNATLNNRAQRLFGNSRIKIDPQGLETETSPTQTGPAVTIEQQVKDNLTLTYTTDVAQTSQQVIRAEYNVSRNVSIVAIRDQNGVVSFDVKIRRRKR
ncbi:MAG TPA: translocation/assembly module TamB domain-containing protein [Terriglobales bacterium]